VDRACATPIGLSNISYGQRKNDVKRKHNCLSKLFGHGGLGVKCLFTCACGMIVKLDVIELLLQLLVRRSPKQPWLKCRGAALVYTSSQIVPEHMNLPGYRAAYSWHRPQQALSVVPI
jgi:hypothetical protein